MQESDSTKISNLDQNLPHVRQEKFQRISVQATVLHPNQLRQTKFSNTTRNQTPKIFESFIS
jgi:hypothetical protein